MRRGKGTEARGWLRWRRAAARSGRDPDRPSAGAGGEAANRVSGEAAGRGGDARRALVAGRAAAGPGPRAGAGRARRRRREAGGGGRPAHLPLTGPPVTPAPPAHPRPGPRPTLLASPP